MVVQGPRSHKYEINAMLRVAERSEDQIRDFLSSTLGVRQSRISLDLHLTVYHSRRVIPGLNEHSRRVHICAGTSETRFMVLVPGGENPREKIDPRHHPVGIRLTKRNAAIPSIQRLREEAYRLETPAVVGGRRPTTAWINCFGSRNYQPHIQLLRRWHKVNTTLAEMGLRFRSEIQEIEFDLFQIESRRRVDGHWVPGSRP